MTRITRKTAALTAGGITLALVLAPVAASADELEQPVEETVAVEEAVEVTEEVALEAVAEEAPVTVEEVAPEAAVELAPVIVMPDISTPFAGVEPLVPTDDLLPLGIRGSFQPAPGAPVIEHDRYMPSVRNAHITGLAKPETSTGTRPDEPVIDLRSLVGNLGGPNRDRPETGFGFTAQGALAATPTHSAAGGGYYSEPLDWSEYTWRIELIGRVGTMDSSNVNGTITLIPFEENSHYGIRATLIHTATGVEAEAVEITGYSGANSDGGFDWVYGPQRQFDGGVPMWEAYDRSAWRDNRFLSWNNPREVISATGAPQTRSTAPTVELGLRADGGELGVPAGFGLWNSGGSVQAGVAGSAPSHRVGQLHSEPVQRVVFDLADSIPGAVAVGLPDASDGVLTLAASPVYERDTRFVGLDYNAPTGAVLTASGTTVTVEFGSAEWVNSVGIWVPVEVNGAVEWVELRTESLPRDIQGGIVWKSIPVSTELLITDTELLEASRLTGLTPSLAEVRAAELPEGVTRVADGFAYAGSEEPTTLAFGFTVAETVETDFGPVRPDSAGPGEVRIAVVEGAVVPTDPEPETPVVVTPPTEVTPTPAPKPDADTPSKAGPRADGNTAGTGDSGFIAAEETDAGIQNLAAIGIFGAFTLALGAIGGWLFGRRKAAQAKA